jgi:hypothetical protein
MAFNFDSQLDIGGRPAWRFVNESGQGYLEPDPRKAAQMGAPIPGLTAASANAAQLAPMPPKPPDLQELAQGSVRSQVRQGELAGRPREANDATSTGSVRSQTRQGELARRDQANAQAAIVPEVPGGRIPTADEQQQAVAAYRGGSNMSATPVSNEMSPRVQAVGSAINELPPLLPSGGMKYVAGQTEGFTPESRKISGPDEDRLNERRAAFGDLEEQRLRVAQTQAERDILQADAERAGAARDATLREIEIAEAEAEKATLDRYYKDGWDSINRDAQEASKASADPDRFLKNKGFGGKLMAAVMIGIGEYGSRMSGGGQNLAHTIIQNAIDKDIEAQREEIAASKDAVGERRNAFARELADGKDPKFAEAKIKYLANLHAQSVAQEAAAAAKDPQIRSAFENTALAIQQDTQNAYLELDKLQKIEATEKFQRGRAGGFTAMTAQERLSEMQANQGIRDILRTESGMAWQTSDAQTKGAEAGAVAAAQAPYKGKDEAAKANDKYAMQVDSVMDQVEDIVTRAGGAIDRETGEIKGAKFVTDLPSLGINTESVTEQNLRLESLGLGFANMANAGAEAGEPSKKKLIPKSEMFDNPKASLQAILKDAVQRKKTLEGKQTQGQIAKGLGFGRLRGEQRKDSGSSR